MDCCDLTVGSSCFCNTQENTGDYYYYYGDCDCTEIASLSVVLLGRDAESITFYDTTSETNIHCSFSNIQTGDEITCKAKGDGIFTDSTSFKVERDDGSRCIGGIDTTCNGDIIVNEVDDRCDELVVTGYVGAEGGVCDDGLQPCYCQEIGGNHDNHGSVVENDSEDSEDSDGDLQC